jgi:lysophospholipase L1-like esterase
MRRIPVLVLVSLLALLPLAIDRASAQAVATAAPSSRPIGFGPDIRAFLESDTMDPPPRDAILFIGSSIFRQWTNVREHMAPLSVFNRAFGGSRTWEVLHYMDQIVLPYRPRIIVYYTGSNDVNAGESAADIVSRTKAFIDRTHAALPETRIYYVAINKSPDKRDRWNVVDAVNNELRAAATSTPHLRHIDLNPVLFDAKGEPRTELYRPDGLHFHPPAYDLFAGIIKPILVGAWKELGKTSAVPDAERSVARGAAAR